MGLRSIVRRMLGTTRREDPSPSRDPFGVYASKSIRARYDAATTTDDNARHWSNVDSLSANAAASHDVRQILRNRSRYETANNSYAKGIVLTLANNLIGEGPRLQVQTENREANEAVERQWSRWSREVNLAAKLRTMAHAKVVDGEAFALLTNNPNHLHPVELDLRLVEAEQVHTPDFVPMENHIDGIRFDAHGNPRSYDVLKHHPGSDTLDAMEAVVDYSSVAADQVLHLFRVDRPGQQRGLPEIMPAMPLFAQLRRYTLAVISAAETAADFAAVLQTRQGADTSNSFGEDEADAPFAGDALPVERGMMGALPEHYEVGQIRAEQPTTTYDGFVQTLLREIARCLLIPYNVAAGDSSAYNYASGRLDHQTYFKAIDVERGEWGWHLDRLLLAFLDEATLIPGVLPAGLPPFVDLPHTWLWGGHEHVDPMKEAKAEEIQLANGTTTLAAIYGRKGKDWLPEIRQKAIEEAEYEKAKADAREKLGLGPEQDDASQPGAAADGKGAAADDQSKSKGEAAETAA